MRLRILCLLPLLLATALAEEATTFSGDRALAHVGRLTIIGKRSAATPNARACATYLASQFERFGYQVTEQPFPVTAFDETSTTVVIHSATPRNLKAYAIAGSPSALLKAPVVRVSPPGASTDIARADLKGKIALVPGGQIPTVDKTRLLAEAGAVAALFYSENGAMASNCGQPAARIPVLAITRREAQAILDDLEQGPVQASLAIDTSIVPKAIGTNIVAVRKGTSPRQLVFGAHYDSVTIATGANDNASGVGVLLEMARLLSSMNRPETLVFVAFDGEERGLVGSSYYVQQLTTDARKGILRMINFDCVGAGKGPFEIQTDDDPMADTATQVAKDLGLPFTLVRDLNGSDHEPFAAAGIPVLAILRMDARIHTPKDTLDSITAPSLASAGALALGCLPR